MVSFVGHGPHYITLTVLDVRPVRVLPLRDRGGEAGPQASPTCLLE